MSEWNNVRKAFTWFGRKVEPANVYAIFLEEFFLFFFIQNVISHFFDIIEWHHKKDAVYCVDLCLKFILQMGY